MNIIRAALRLAARVAGVQQRARAFYYRVVLCEHRCPRCNGSLAMVRESWCRCRECGFAFDPTAAFQRCACCGGIPHLRVRRYVCDCCGQDIPSRFVFDGLAFDTEYFRQKMAEHRQRQRQQRERIRQMLAENRSSPVVLGGADLDSVPGLIDTLAALSAGPSETVRFVPRSSFDLRRYEAHVAAHLRVIAIGLDDIPPLIDDLRLDRIWRFIAIIFLAHAGTLDVWQEGTIIKVIKHETHTEGQGIPGETEELDRVAGLVGRAPA